MADGQVVPGLPLPTTRVPLQSPTVTDGHPEGGESVRDALTFARELAREEIASIERIHARTLASFHYIGLAVAAVGGLFGYIGYTNLRDTAIKTAQDQMRAEVTRQVQQMLTKQNVESIVQEQVRSYSATKMSDAIHLALTTPAESAFIRDAAAKEAQNQIKQQFAQRHFTDAQSNAFVKAVNAQADLDGYPVTVLSMSMNSEATTYANEIKASVIQTKLKYVAGFGGYTKEPVDGIAIYWARPSHESDAQLLQRSFRDCCGIDAKIVEAPPAFPYAAGKESPLVIFVGPRHF